MLIVIEKNTRNIKRKFINSKFPDGNFDVKMSSEEQAVRIHDGTELANRINRAKKSIRFNENLDDIIEEEETPEEIEAKENQIRQQKVNRIKAEIIQDLPELITMFLPTFITLLNATGKTLTPREQELLAKYDKLKGGPIDERS